jgi:uncharacterized protein (TIGR03435 family)
MRAGATLIGCLLTATLVAALAAQTQTTFDVVSIKPNTSGQAGGGFRATPTGRIEWTNVTAGTLIGVAHQRFPFDVVEAVGAPDWVDRDRFDVIAQTRPDAASPPRTAELTAMLRAMLAERFRLVTHWEQRERSVYVLIAKPGSPLGPGIRTAPVGCGEGVDALTGGGRASMRPGRGPSCTFGGGPGNLQGNAVTVAMFARVLGGSELRRPVIDRTGLTGNYDIDLRYRPDLGSRPDGPPPAPPDPDAPSIFTAVEEQLGLKLVADRAPVDVLVIDRLERPTAD